MTHAKDIETLRKRFASAWTAYGEKTVTVLYDNDRAGSTPPAKFISFSVRPSGQEDAALGGELSRTHTFGRIWMQIAIPVGDASNDAWKLADKAQAIFRRWRSPEYDLSCGTSETRVVNDAKHYIVNVNIKYEGRHYL